MATWDGHLLGGLFLIIQGLWWIVLTIWYKLNSEQSSSKKRSSRCFQTGSQAVASKTGCAKSWIPQPFLPNVPIEPIAKIVACSIGAFGETFLTLHVEEDEKPRRLEFKPFEIFNSSGDFVRVDKFQHVTMYTGFVLSGIVDLFILVASFPRNTSPLFFTIAFVSQAVLFSFHMGHTVLNGTYHKLHLVLVICCVVFSGLRTHYIKNTFVNIALGCSILFQGTWFFQASFLIYKDGNIRWELHKTEPHSEKLLHMVPMYMSAVFAWHLMVIAMVVLIVWCVMHFAINKTCIIQRKHNTTEWEALPSECSENFKLIETHTAGTENDTEI